MFYTFICGTTFSATALQHCPLLETGGLNSRYSSRLPHCSHLSLKSAPAGGVRGDAGREETSSQPFLMTVVQMDQPSRIHLLWSLYSRCCLWCWRFPDLKFSSDAREKVSSNNKWWISFYWVSRPTLQTQISSTENIQRLRLNQQSCSCHVRTTARN